jgi:hypothetical protein
LLLFILLSLSLFLLFFPDFHHDTRFGCFVYTSEYFVQKLDYSACIQSVQEAQKCLDLLKQVGTGTGTDWMQVCKTFKRGELQ